MKQILILLLTVATLALQSCKKDDNGKHRGVDVGPVVQTAFDSRYPAAYDVDWKVQGSYYVADFEIDNIDGSAWFDNGGNWYMTESDILYTALPTAVQTAFKANPTYGAWLVDDVDMIERAGAATVYVIEVEQGNTDVDLYYTAAGVLVKTVFDADDNYDYDDFIPTQLPAEIQTYLNTNHLGYQLIDVDYQANGTIEIEIVHSGVVMELYFNSAKVWQATVSEIFYTALPQAVKNAIAAWQTTSLNYRIDDIDLVKTSASTTPNEWYAIEMENDITDREVRLRFETNGTFIDEKPIL